MPNWGYLAIFLEKFPQQNVEIHNQLKVRLFAKYTTFVLFFPRIRYLLSNVVF